MAGLRGFSFFFFNDTATTEIYTLSLHDALPIWETGSPPGTRRRHGPGRARRSTCSECEWCRRSGGAGRSEEHTSELQSLRHLVCRLLLEKKKKSEKSPAPSTTPTSGSVHMAPVL